MKLEAGLVSDASVTFVAALQARVILYLSTGNATAGRLNRHGLCKDETSVMCVCLNGPALVCVSELGLLSAHNRF